MITQIPLYIFCYIIGWLPLHYMYQIIEKRIPFTLNKTKATFSFLPLAKLMYICLELCRGYLIMHIVHEWLSFDIDLIIGIGLFLVGIFWPMFTPKKTQSYVWVVLAGIYGYLFPYFGWSLPFIFLLLTLTGIPFFWAYFIIGVFFTIIGIFSDPNTLYITFYCLLFIGLLIKSLSYKNQKLLDLN